MSFVVSPTGLEEALSFLAANPEARPLSGGASLVAMKNARLVDASFFVSLANIDALRGIELRGDMIRIGGMCRHRDIASSALLDGDLEMVRLAARQIANRVVRNMGTIGGAIGNADPAADYLPVLLCADATIEVASLQGSRLLSVNEYIVGWYETALKPGELVTAVHLKRPKQARSVYHKLARTPGDYATISVACAGEGRSIRLAVGACGPKPIRSQAAEAQLGEQLDDTKAISRFARDLADLADPVDDVRGSSEYRLRLIPRMVAEAISEVRQTA